MKLGFLAAFVLVALVLEALASSQQPQVTRQPSFRVTTEVISADVTVLDRDDVPVRDLRPEDFTVRVDGQPRRVVSLQFVDQSIRAAAGDGAPGRPVVSTNESTGAGRLVLIVVDEPSIKFGGLRAAAQSIDRLLAGLGPSDRVGLAVLPGPRMLVEFARDRQPIADAIKKIPGGADSLTNLRTYHVSVTEAFAIQRGDSMVWQTVMQRECGAATGRGGMEQQACANQLQMDVSETATQVRNQAAEFQGGLQSLLRALRAIDMPKIVILFSEGVLSPEAPTDLAPLAYDAAAARTVIDVMRLDRTMFDLADRNPMSSYFEQRSLARSSLDALAGPTRGSVFEIVASSEGVFTRLAREMSGYYLLGIEPEGSDRDGKPHRIQVSTTKPGVTLRARSGFVFAPPRAVTTDEAKLVAQAMQTPFLATEVPLRLATFNLADEDPARVRVMLAAEIDRDQEKDGPARVGYQVYDERGKALLGYDQRVDLKRTPSGALAFVNVGLLPQGTYIIKLAVVRDGRTGSVEHRFTARLTGAMPFQIGDLIFGNPQDAATGLQPALDARVPSNAMHAFVQVHCARDAPKDANFVLEVVNDEKGPALIRVPLALNVARGTVRVAQGDVDGGLLPPGEYGARLLVTVADKPVGQVFTRFIVERVPRAAGGTRRGMSAGAYDKVRFHRQDLLTADVLGPFLDELAALSPAASRAAIEAAKAGKFDQSAQQVKSADGDPSGAFLRGLALYADGALQPASDAFRDAVRASPDLLLGVFYIGACYAAGGKDQQAINAWQTSLVSLDKFPVVYRVLTDGLVRTGHADQATDLLKEATARWPDDDGLQLRMASANAEAGHSEALLAYVDRAVERRTVDSEILFRAMQAIFEEVADGLQQPTDAVLGRLRRYRDAYSAIGGIRAPLVGEWVAFIERRLKSGTSNEPESVRQKVMGP